MCKLGLQRQANAIYSYVWRTVPVMASKQTAGERVSPKVSHCGPLYRAGETYSSWPVIGLQWHVATLAMRANAKDCFCSGRLGHPSPSSSDLNQASKLKGMQCVRPIICCYVLHPCQLMEMKSQRLLLLLDTASGLI